MNVPPSLISELSKRDLRINHEACLLHSTNHAVVCEVKRGYSSPITAGSIGHNEKIVIKHISRDRAAVRSINKVLDLASRVEGLRVPRVFAASCGEAADDWIVADCKTPFIAYTFLSGRNVTPRVHTNTVCLVGRRLIDFHMLTNELSTDVLSDVSSLELGEFVTQVEQHGMRRFLSRLPGQYGDLVNSATKLVKAHLCAEDLASSVVVHGDLHLGNIVVGRKHLGFIDFDELKFSSPLLDVAAVVASLWQLPRGIQLVDSLLRGYGLGRIKSARTRQGILAIVLFRRLSLLARVERARALKARECDCDEKTAKLFAKVLNDICIDFEVSKKLGIRLSESATSAV